MQARAEGAELKWCFFKVIIGKVFEHFEADLST